MATYNVRKILKAVADVRKHTPANARICLVGRPICWPTWPACCRPAPTTPSRAASAGPSTSSAGPTCRPVPKRCRGGRSSCSSKTLGAGQARARPTIAFCRAADLPAIVAAVRDTEAVPVDRHAWIALAGLSGREFVLHTPRHAGRQVGARAAHRPGPGHGGFALAATLPALRPAVIGQTIEATARQNALVGAVIFCRAPTCR